jgi:type IV pilus assembly protein PilM
MFFNKNLLTIDIGSKYIKFLKFKGSKHFKIKELGICELPDGIVTNGNIIDKKNFLLLFKQALISNYISKENISITLDSSLTQINIIDINLDKDEILEEAILYNAEQSLGKDLSDTIYDYKVIEKPTNSFSNNYKIVFASTARETVDPLIELFKSINLNIKIIDIDVFSLINMIEFNYGKIPNLYVLIHIGYSSTNVIICNNNNYLYSRKLSIGSKNLCSNLAEILKIEEKTSQKIFLSNKKLKSNIMTSVDECYKLLTDEINNTLHYYLSQSNLEQETKKHYPIFISGGCAAFYKLNEHLTKHLNNKVIIINPFRKITHGSFSLKKYKPSNLSKNDLINNMKAHFSIASGLALRTYKQNFS